MRFSVGGLIGSLVFSGIGFVAFTAGRKQQHYRLMGFGALMMGYSYFTSGAALTWGIGAALTAAWYFLSDWLNQA